MHTIEHEMETGREIEENEGGMYMKRKRREEEEERRGKGD